MVFKTQTFRFLKCDEDKKNFIFYVSLYKFQCIHSVM